MTLTIFLLKSIGAGLWHLWLPSHIRKGTQLLSGSLGVLAPGNEPPGHEDAHAFVRRSTWEETQDLGWHSWTPRWQSGSTYQPCEWAILKVDLPTPSWTISSNATWHREGLACWVLPKFYIRGQMKGLVLLQDTVFCEGLWHSNRQLIQGKRIRAGTSEWT